MTTPKVSVIMPAFCRFMDFVSSVEHNDLFFHPLVEIVLVLDTPEEERFYHWWLNRNHGRFQVRMLVYDDAHEWRQPGHAINAGIAHSIGEWCAVQSPESVVMFPSVNHLFQVIAAQEKPFFLTGLLISCTARQVRGHDTFRQLYRDGFSKPTVGFGWILFRRRDALKMGGYDCERKGYGGDDNSIRDRFERAGLKHINDPAIRVVHVDRRTHDRDTSKMEPWKDTPVRLTNENMGKGFRKSYDWIDAL